tara:strand:- start:3412 stop:10929 length:7518 start_codon:yes stop_codon:yes gene_type:complete
MKKTGSLTTIIITIVIIIIFYLYNNKKDKFTSPDVITSVSTSITPECPQYCHDTRIFQNVELCDPCFVIGGKYEKTAEELVANKIEPLVDLSPGCPGYCKEHSYRYGRCRRCFLSGGPFDDVEEICGNFCNRNSNRVGICKACFDDSGNFKGEEEEEKCKSYCDKDSYRYGICEPCFRSGGKFAHIEEPCLEVCNTNSNKQGICRSCFKEGGRLYQQKSIPLKKSTISFVQFEAEEIQPPHSLNCPSFCTVKSSRTGSACGPCFDSTIDGIFSDAYEICPENCTKFHDNTGECRKCFEEGGRFYVAPYSPPPILDHDERIAKNEIDQVTYYQVQEDHAPGCPWYCSTNSYPFTPSCKKCFEDGGPFEEVTKDCMNICTTANKDDKICDPCFEEGQRLYQSPVLEKDKEEIKIESIPIENPPKCAEWCNNSFLYHSANYDMYCIKEEEKLGNNCYKDRSHIPEKYVYPARCKCNNGNGDKTVECAKDSTLIKCIKCNNGYKLNGNNECELKQCICDNGIANNGNKCSNVGEHSCATCNEGFILVKGKCYKRFDENTSEEPNTYNPIQTKGYFNLIERFNNYIDPSDGGNVYDFEDMSVAKVLNANTIQSCKENCDVFETCGGIAYKKNSIDECYTMSTSQNWLSRDIPDNINSKWTTYKRSNPIIPEISSLPNIKPKKIKYFRTDKPLKKYFIRYNQNSPLEFKYDIDKSDGRLTTDITKSLHSGTIESCKELCNTLDYCGGFSYNKDNKTCNLKNNNLKTVSLMQDNNYDTYSKNEITGSKPEYPSCDSSCNELTRDNLFRKDYVVDCIRLNNTGRNCLSNYPDVKIIVDLELARFANLAAKAAKDAEDAKETRLTEEAQAASSKSGVSVAQERVNILLKQEQEVLALKIKEEQRIKKYRDDVKLGQDLFQTTLEIKNKSLIESGERYKKRQKELLEKADEEMKVIEAILDEKRTKIENIVNIQEIKFIEENIKQEEDNKKILEDQLKIELERAETRKKSDNKFIEDSFEIIRLEYQDKQDLINAAAEKLVVAQRAKEEELENIRLEKIRLENERIQKLLDFETLEKSRKRAREIEMQRLSRAKIRDLLIKLRVATVEVDKMDGTLKSKEAIKELDDRQISEEISYELQAGQTYQKEISTKSSCRECDNIDNSCGGIYWDEGKKKCSRPCCTRNGKSQYCSKWGYCGPTDDLSHPAAWTNKDSYTSGIRESECDSIAPLQTCKDYNLDYKVPKSEVLESSVTKQHGAVITTMSDSDSEVIDNSLDKVHNIALSQSTHTRTSTRIGNFFVVQFQRVKTYVKAIKTVSDIKVDTSKKLIAAEEDILTSKARFETAKQERSLLTETIETQDEEITTLGKEITLTIDKQDESRIVANDDTYDKEKSILQKTFNPESDGDVVAIKDVGVSVDEEDANEELDESFKIFEEAEKAQAQNRLKEISVNADVMTGEIEVQSSISKFTSAQKLDTMAEEQLDVLEIELNAIGDTLKSGFVDIEKRNEDFDKEIFDSTLKASLTQYQQEKAMKNLKQEQQQDWINTNFDRLAGSSITEHYKLDSAYPEPEPNSREYRDSNKIISIKYRHIATKALYNHLFSDHILAITSEESEKLIEELLSSAATKTHKKIEADTSHTDRLEMLFSERNIGLWKMSNFELTRGLTDGMMIKDFQTLLITKAEDKSPYTGADASITGIEEINETFKLILNNYIDKVKITIEKYNILKAYQNSYIRLKRERESLSDYDWRKIIAWTGESYKYDELVSLWDNLNIVLDNFAIAKAASDKIKKELLELLKLDITQYEINQDANECKYTTIKKQIYDDVVACCNKNKIDKYGDCCHYGKLDCDGICNGLDNTCEIAVKSETPATVEKIDDNEEFNPCLCPNGWSDSFRYGDNGQPIDIAYDNPNWGCTKDSPIRCRGALTSSDEVSVWRESNGDIMNYCYANFIPIDSNPDEPVTQAQLESSAFKGCKEPKYLFTCPNGKHVNVNYNLDSSYVFENKWIPLGSIKPIYGTELINDMLSKKLINKSEFTQEEWSVIKEGFSDPNISISKTHFIKSEGNVYFRPDSNIYPQYNDEVNCSKCDKDYILKLNVPRYCTDSDCLVYKGECVLKDSIKECACYHAENPDNSHISCWDGSFRTNQNKDLHPTSGNLMDATSTKEISRVGKCHKCYSGKGPWSDPSRGGRLEDRGIECETTADCAVEWIGKWDNIPYLGAGDNVLIDTDADTNIEIKENHKINTHTNSSCGNGVDAAPCYFAQDSVLRYNQDKNAPFYFNKAYGRNYKCVKGKCCYGHIPIDSASTQPPMWEGTSSSDCQRDGQMKCNNKDGNAQCKNKIGFDWTYQPIAYGTENYNKPKLSFPPKIFGDYNEQTERCERYQYFLEQDELGGDVGSSEQNTLNGYCDYKHWYTDGRKFSRAYQSCYLGASELSREPNASDWDSPIKKSDFESLIIDPTISDGTLLTTLTVDQQNREEYAVDKNGNFTKENNDNSSYRSPEVGRMNYKPFNDKEVILNYV